MIMIMMTELIIIIIMMDDGDDDDKDNAIKDMKNPSIFLSLQNCRNQKSKLPP